MPLYTYQKDLHNPEQPAETETSPQVITADEIKFASTAHILPLFISLFGILLVAFVVWPIVSYELNIKQPSKKVSNLLSPLVEQATALASTIPAPKIVGGLDYTKANNWFPQANNPSSQSASANSPTYGISIPKLGIDDAVVKVGSNDLSKSLIHYQETALPGELGSPVIFGHSILPQFYNPKNYNSIFSTLPSLDTGDTINVSFDGINYEYKVTEKEEVFPEDLWVLEQQYDKKRLKLITCVPPGLKTRRLVITAELVQI